MVARVTAPGSLDSPLLIVFAVVSVVVFLFIPMARLGRGPLETIARRLPASLDGGFRRRPVSAMLVVLLMVMAIVQIARLSCFMADPALEWGSAYPPEEFGVRHMCLSAYIYAADLSRKAHPNVYSEELYPVYRFDRSAEPPTISSDVLNLAPYVRDAFEYPPPFLLLPRAALALTNDFLVIRTGWFMLQVPLFLTVALTLARQVGGRRGTLAGILIAGLLASFPFLFNFQFGQFHLAALVLAVAGMMAFESGRDRLGSAFLAGAIVTKVFPGILLIYLAIRRRYSAIVWTLVFCAAYTLGAFLVLGPAPFRAFVEYHVPRVISGEAFTFYRETDVILAANASVYSIPLKLQRLGVPGMSAAVASWLTWLYTAFLIGATVLAARRRDNTALEPTVWLALLTLCSLRTPVAPNVYVGTSAMWLLTLLAVETHGRLFKVILLVLAWVCISIQPPLPDLEGTIALWMSGQIAMLVLGFWIVLRRKPHITYRTTMRTWPRVAEEYSIE
jgi:hypothetical protein